MASLTPGESAKKALRQIQFKLGGKRRTIRLPAMTWLQAIALKHRVEHLVSCKLTDTTPNSEVSRWLGECPDEFYGRLSATGLVEPRDRSQLGEFVSNYMASRTDVNPSTRRKWISTRNTLFRFFGEARSLRSITPGDAEDWRRSLGSGDEAEGRPDRRLAENTLRKHTAVAKLFFNVAVKKKLIPANPFQELKATIVPNPTRYHFVSRDVAESVIDACPDAEWRLLFALSRYGGLRCPSEHLGLRWSDIDWANGRFRVRSPKTAHHVGKDSRLVPIFPELRPYLEEAWELAPKGAEYVIARYRDQNANLRTQLCRIIDRAGVDPWPKLFQNLRSTRQTELEESFPSHVVCAWLGNSEDVARAHYLQVTDDHFARAAEMQHEESGVDRRCKKRRTHYPESPCTVGQPKSPTPVFAGDCDTARNGTGVQVAEAGLEPARGLPPTGF